MFYSNCNSGTKKSNRLIAGFFIILFFIAIKHLHRIRDPVYYAILNRTKHATRVS